MIPATIDFPCRTNADYGEEIAFVENDVPIDLSGLTVQMQVRKYPKGPLLFSVAVDVLDAANGVISFNIDRNLLSQAYDSTVGNQIGAVAQAVHDIRFIHSDDRAEVWAQGVLTIEPGVTV